MPVVYEVNIDVHGDIHDAYVAWLLPHMEKMYTLIDGMTDARLLSRGAVDTPADLTGEWKGVTASYTIGTRAALNDYLENRAAAMRAEALEKFSTSQFRATRRIMDVSLVVPPPA